MPFQNPVEFSDAPQHRSPTPGSRGRLHTPPRALFLKHEPDHLTLRPQPLGTGDTASPNHASTEPGTPLGRGAQGEGHGGRAEQAQFTGRRPSQGSCHPGPFGAAEVGTAAEVEPPSVSAAPSHQPRLTNEETEAQRQQRAAWQSQDRSPGSLAQACPDEGIAAPPEAMGLEAEQRGHEDRAQDGTHGCPGTGTPPGRQEAACGTRWVPNECFNGMRRFKNKKGHRPAPLPCTFYAALRTAGRSSGGRETETLRGKHTCSRASRVAGSWSRQVRPRYSAEPLIQALFVWLT